MKELPRQSSNGNVKIDSFHRRAARRERRNMKTWITFSVSSFAVILSLIAIGVTLPTVGELNFDYYGAIVGVLSFLITILMGYQIYTVINVKEELKEMSSFRKSIDTKLAEQKNAITAEYKQEFEYTLPLFVALSKHDLVESIINSFEVFAKTHEGSWARGFAYQTLVLTLLEIDDALFNSITDKLCLSVEDKEVVALHSYVNKLENEGQLPDADKFRHRLNTIISKISDSRNGKNI